MQAFQGERRNFSFSEESRNGSSLLSRVRFLPSHCSILDYDGSLAGWLTGADRGRKFQLRSKFIALIALASGRGINLAPVPYSLAAMVALNLNTMSLREAATSGWLAAKSEFRFGDLLIFLAFAKRANVAHSNSVSICTFSMVLINL